MNRHVSGPNYKQFVKGLRSVILSSLNRPLGDPASVPTRLAALSGEDDALSQRPSLSPDSNCSGVAKVACNLAKTTCR